MILVARRIAVGSSESHSQQPIVNVVGGPEPVSRDLFGILLSNPSLLGVGDNRRSTDPLRRGRRSHIGALGFALAERERAALSRFPLRRSRGLPLEQARGRPACPKGRRSHRDLPVGVTCELEPDVDSRRAAAPWSYTGEQEARRFSVRLLDGSRHARSLTFGGRRGAHHRSRLRRPRRRTVLGPGSLLRF
jgi:hypothetical protein